MHVLDGADDPMVAGAVARVARCLRRIAPRIAACLCLCAAATAQRWQELQGRSRSGIVELRQAVLDAGSDRLALLVASHPDDRYLLPAVYLRFALGMRVAVMIASRGGGGQNSLGPETGDALERIRTLETEAGCSLLDAKVYWLDRPDRGFRRTAQETFGEWGRADTLQAMTRLLREIRPDLVVSTHNREETHGHDLAVVELLPEAVMAAADVGNTKTPGAPHRVPGLLLGALTTSLRPAAVIHADRFEPNRGASLRRLAHDILARCHVSPGHPGPMETVFTAEMGFDAPDLPWPQARTFDDGLPSLFAAGVWTPPKDGPDDLPQLAARLAGAGDDRTKLIELAVAGIRALESLPFAAGSDAAVRRDRRCEALRRVVLHANAVQLEVEPRPGAVAVPGEELSLEVRVHAGGERAVDLVRLGNGAGVAEFEAIEADRPSVPAGAILRGIVDYRVPLGLQVAGDPRSSAFRGDRFAPPLLLDFRIATCGVEIAVPVAPPIEVRAPLELFAWPRMLLCPTRREEVRFSVEVVHNSMFPVEGQVDVRAPAGYQVRGERTAVSLVHERGDTFDFTLRPPADRKTGVDVIRISVGDSRVLLPLHKVDVQIDPQLRIGLVRNRDDALVSTIGVGGFGLQWSELTDSDLAVQDLSGFDTIAVEARALRDRPAARRSFRRLLEFCGQPGKRLVVFYHKDVEFDPPGEGFVGAPFPPFSIGKDRVTHADAPVTLLRPDHVLLQQPNRILPGDWDGWEQERGLYFPANYSSDYEEILQLGDPGLPPRSSALLYARCGPHSEGEYVYCALSLWRQLKKLHPGSVRLLANLLTPRKVVR